MTKTVLNVKTDIKVKKAAQKLAKEMGIPLSTIVNAHLKQFVDERRFVVQTPLVPNKRLRKIIAQTEKDWRGGNTKAFSPVFDNAEDATAWLDAHV